MTPTGACPKCSFPAPPGALECPACGVVYAKYRRGAPPPPVPEADGVWRDGAVLVMRREARLPGRCVKCDDRADGRLRKALLWHAPGVYLALLFHVLVYAPLALLLAKRVEVEIPLCLRHLRRRRRMLVAGWTLMAAAVALVATVFLTRDYPGLLLLAVFVGGAGAITAGLAAQIVVPHKIDDHHVWIERVCEEYLDRLPEAPAELADPRRGLRKRSFLPRARAGARP